MCDSNKNWQQVDSVVQAHVLSSQLSAKESQTAAIAFGPDQSNVVVYSSPMLQHQLLVYDYQQGAAVRLISMQQPLSVLCGPLADGSTVFADVSGTVGILDLASGSTSLQGTALVSDQCFDFARC